MKRGVIAGILLTLLGPNQASAQPVASPPDKLDLEWTAPTECPTREHVLAEIGQLARQRKGRASRARVIVSRSASGEYHAQITLRVGAAFDEREVSGATCAEIADASALLIALALEPVARPRASSPKQPASPIATNSASHHVSFRVGATVGLETLALPRPVSTLRPTLGVSIDRVLLAIEGFVSPSVGLSLAGEPQKGAYFRLLGAKLAGCWISPFGQLRAGPCAGVGVMGIGTEGFGVSQTRDTVTWTPSATAEARLFWSPIPRFEGLFQIVLGVPAERLEFSVESTSGSRLLHRVTPMTLAVGIGIARLWDLF